MSVSAGDRTVIRAGWVDKKSMRSLRATGFVRRYMVLEPTRLYHLAQPLSHSLTPSENSKEEILFEINLEIINDIINRDYHEKGLGKFDIVTPSRHLTIRCVYDDKLLWIRDIQEARSRVMNSTHSLTHSLTHSMLYKSIPTVPHIPGVSKKIKNIFRGSGECGSGGVSADTRKFTYEQARALSELFDFMCSSTELCSTIVTAVFEALNALSGSEKSKAAKQLGQVLAIWLGESENQVENTRRASRLSVSRAGKPSQIDILTVWLEIGLVREFKVSCSFSPQVWTYSDRGSGGESGDKGSSDTSSGSTDDNCSPGTCIDKSDHYKVKNEATATNIPFRRDNVECLFILSFIKSVAQNTGMLSTWLMPSLHVISQNPENFLKVKTSPPPPAATNNDTNSAKRSIGSASAIVSTIKNLVRSSVEDDYRSSQGISCDEEEDVVVITAGKTDKESDRKSEDLEASVTIVSRVFKLQYDDFLHLESVKIIDKMTKTQEYIPPSFKLLILTIFRLTVQTSNFKTRMDYLNTHSNNDKTDSDQEKELKSTRRYESKPEYGVYYSSACATLFLRLICPALLSPLEWGVLSQKSMLTHLSQKKLKKQQDALSFGSQSGGSGSSDSIVQDGEKRKKRDVFKRLLLGRKKPPTPETCYDKSYSDNVDRDQDFVSDMNDNPAAAAIILVAHILSNCNVEEFWSSTDAELDNFQQIQQNIVRCVPIEKLDSFVAVYETEQCRSIVDPSTKTTFESAPVRKGLMGLAKDMQRLANLSIAPTDEMKAQAESVFSRLHANHGEEPPTEEYSSKEIDFQVQQAIKIQELYDSLGESSKYISILSE